MNGDTINDLKQFFSAQFVQHTAHLATKEDVAKIVKSELKNELDSIHNKIDAIQDFLENSTMPFVQEIDDQVQKHEKRIAKLEQKAA